QASFWSVSSPITINTVTLNPDDLTNRQSHINFPTWNLSYMEGGFGIRLVIRRKRRSNWCSKSSENSLLSQVDVL
ncbi:hypothetical protein AKJ16_DCAP18370, partial [Drosera capensis]